MRTILLISALASMVFVPSFAQEAVPAQVHSLISTLQQWGGNPTLIDTLKQHNEQKLSLASIKKRDEQWQSTEGVDEFMQSLSDNAAAKELAKLEASAGYFTELFLMGNQGENVAMTNKTSDYWQGDEAKFIESYKSGIGAVHVGKVEFDESAQAYLVQISVPVLDAGRAIGALTIGVNLDKFELVE